MIIKNGKVITPDEVLDGFDLRIEEGLIKEIGRSLTGDQTVDADGAYIVPGFVDIHTHGGCGADFMDATKDAFDKALGFHLGEGTTTVVATSCTAPKDSIVRFLGFAKEYMRRSRVVAGVHLEGPYLSVRNKGAQKEEYLAVPATVDYSYMLDYADVIKTVTISPELPGAAEMTTALLRTGITVSGGHDDGIYPEFMPTIEAGMSHLTHLYCAMSELRFKDGIRNVGLREYALTDDRLTVELIADNRHIPPHLARLVLRAKGADKVAVVSDSLRCAGCPKDGAVYKLGADENAQLVKIGDGVAVTADGERFAGSITSVRQMVKNLIDAGIGVTDAVKTGTITPAKIIGEDKTVGSIEIGKRANIAVLDTDWNLAGVYLDGTRMK
ncbi:MAG: N-acetylglucosamine-6-phosphate deacetylase [Clostridia bacterium]|nr:N-acetylglucosamine-6-phosphate deacetylase [Clostridia bacterium]